MTTDIAARLRSRSASSGWMDKLDDEAADEIERLRHEARYGTHLIATAKSLGWKNDGGEGPQEFLLRRTREVALEDCTDEIERLRAALTDIRDLTEHHADADELFGTLFGTARAALTAHRGV